MGALHRSTLRTKSDHVSGASLAIVLKLQSTGVHCQACVYHKALAPACLCVHVHVQGGTDVGDHPPITPVRAATESELGGGEAWLIYDYVARHFLGSLSGDCLLKRTKAVFTG